MNVNFAQVDLSVTTCKKFQTSQHETLKFVRSCKLVRRERSRKSNKQIDRDRETGRKRHNEIQREKRRERERIGFKIPFSVS